MCKMFNYNDFDAIRPSLEIGDSYRVAWRCITPCRDTATHLGSGLPLDGQPRSSLSRSAPLAKCAATR